MSKDRLNSNNIDSTNYQLARFLRYKKECEAAGKDVSFNEWIRVTGKLNTKIDFEESVILGHKIAEEKDADAKEALKKEALEKKTALEQEINKANSHSIDKTLKKKTKTIEIINL